MSLRRRRLVAAAAMVAVVGGVVGVLVATLSGSGTAGPLLVPRVPPPTTDPLAYLPGDRAALEQAAAAGYAHVLYVKSPGGIVASAARTAAFRLQVDAATKGTHVDADLLEAIVLLESAGRPDAIAGSDPVAAAGLTQIVAGTAQSFLGMHVDLAASRRLTAQITAAENRGDQREADRLRARRRLVDERFDPARALAASVRYLETARARLGRDDLAIVSYHMGIGNLTSVIRDYTGDRSSPVRDVVARGDLTYAQLYFDSSPVDHAAAWSRLAGLGDDSKTYYWRVLAAREVMRLYRHDRGRLEELARLQTGKASGEDVLHPLSETDRFTSPGAVARALGRHAIDPIPNRPADLHLRLAPALAQAAAGYRALRPEALALLLYVAGRVYALSGATRPLIVTAATEDERSQAAPGYSLHTTGYAFDIRRSYESGAQAAAFQYELERLQARDLIAWIREPDVIHVVVSGDAAGLERAFLRRAPG